MMPPIQSRGRLHRFRWHRCMTSSWPQTYPMCALHMGWWGRCQGATWRIVCMFTYHRRSACGSIMYGLLRATVTERGNSTLATPVTVDLGISGSRYIQFGAHFKRCPSPPGFSGGTHLQLTLCSYARIRPEGRSLSTPGTPTNTWTGHVVGIWRPAYARRIT